jgi:hypothetical protein
MFGVAITISLMSVTSVTAVPLKTPVIPTLHSSTGKLYRAGEFCPSEDLNSLDHGSNGIIKCERVNGGDRWEHHAA